jgi:hypothetical protein
MEMYLWDRYKSSEVTNLIKYWVDVWEDLIINNNKNSYGLTFISPHLILLDIIDEIEMNSFKNVEVKKYYKRKIEDYVKNDVTIHSKFKTRFDMLRREFGGNNYMYMSQLCKEMVKEFKSGKFFRECFLQLKKQLLEPNPNIKSYQTIKLLSEQLIIELVLKGYDLKSIRKFPIHIFSTYHKYSDHHVVTDYPHTIRIKDFIIGNGETDYIAYNMAVMNEVDQASVEERLERFLGYFFRERETYTYIFNIEGLIGVGEWIVGDVHFYSPNELTYIQNSFREKEKDQLHEEYFHGTVENHFINAAVQVEVLDVNSSVTEAVEKIEKALDTIRCFYHSEVKFEVATEEYYVLDKESKRVRSSLSASNRLAWYKWQSSFLMEKLSDDFLDVSNQFLFLSSQTNLERKITQSLRWYRKAEEAPTMEDKLLAYWIVIENFMNVTEDALVQLIPNQEKSSKFMIAKEVIAAINTRSVFYRYGWELYHYLRYLTSSFQGGRKLLQLSEQTMEKTGLVIEEGKVHLYTFVRELDKLEQEVDREIIKEKIIFAKDFYKNHNQLQKTMLETWNQNTQDEMLLLYRLRNKIVHNAHYDYTILPVYVEKARMFAGDILRFAIREHHQDHSINLENLILKALIEFKIMMAQLKNNETLDILAGGN